MEGGRREGWRNEQRRRGEEGPGPLIGSLLSYCLLHHHCFPRRFPHTFKWPFQKTPAFPTAVSVSANKLHL